MTQPSAALSITGTVTNVACYGDQTGAIDITVTGGSTPYTYSWSNGATTEDLTGLSAGTYTVTVTDAHSCTAMESYTVTQPSAALSINMDSIIGQSCYGVSDGAVYITVSGGTIPYTYNWTGPGGFTASTEDIAGLMPGTYYVTVTDAHNCVATDSAVVPGVDPLQIALNGNIQNVSCYGANDGAIDITVTGGTAPYAYSWTGPNGFTASTEDISGLEPGTYTVVVTDAHFCTDTQQYTITQPQPLTISATLTSVTCWEGSDGAIDLTVSGGTSPYTYQWSNGATMEDISGLMAGVYMVTVTDVNGCWTTGNYTIGTLTHLTSQYAAIDPHCGEDNGSIDLTVLGGSGFYTYLWSNGATTEDLDSLGAGTYTVLITDTVYGCTAIDTVHLQNVSAPLLSAQLNNTNCSGLIGSIDLSVSGGSGLYTYAWNNGATTQDLTGLAAGNYVVTVTDSVTGCIAIGSYTIHLVNDLTLTATVTPATCGFANGSIALTVGNGSGSYTYQWNTGATTSNISNLNPGVYGVTVTDQVSSCVVTGFYTLSGFDAPTVTATVTDVVCAGGSDGTIDLTVTGGSGTYYYQWSNGATIQNLVGLTAGLYIVTVTDSATGCQAVEQVSVGENPPIDIIANRTFISCAGAGDGSIDLIISGGTAPYTVLWSTGDTTLNISNLTPGTYTVSVTDANGCTNSLPVPVTEPDTLQISLVNVNPSGCYGMPQGMIDISVSGGTMPYSYQWSNGATTQDLQNLWSGIYSVTVTDAHGCMDSMMVVVNSNALINLSAQITNINCDGGNTGAIDLTVSGGSGFYIYNWSNGATTEDIVNLAAGLYLVTVTDTSNGCEVYGTYSVVDSNFAISSAVVNTTCGMSNGAIYLFPSGGSGVFSYNWSNGGPDASSQTGLPAGIYSVTITDTITGCWKALSYTLDNVEGPDVTGVVTNASACAANDGSIDITVSGGSGSYTYLWSNFASTQDINNLMAGTYTVTVTDDTTGCQTIASFTVGEDNTMGLTAQIIPANCGHADGEIYLGVSGGSGSYSFSWSNGATTQNLIGVAAGTYIVIVTDLGSTCTDTLAVTLGETGGPVVSYTKTDITCAGDFDGAIDLTVSGNGTYYYNWSTGDTTQDLTNLVAGTYIVTVTDSATGCTSSLQVTITEPPAINVVANTTAVTCHGGNDGSISVSASGGSPGYAYSWTGPGGFSSTNQNISNLSAGNYVLTVTDTTGCAIIVTIPVIEPAAIVLNLDSTVEASCEGSTDGIIYISATGGTPPYMFNMNGTTPQPGGSFSSLASGFYTVYVTDANGCTDSMDINLTHGDGLQLTGIITPVSCDGGNNGAIDLTVSGGSGSYFFYWSNGATTEDISNLTADIYVVTVIDSMSGCYATKAFTVTDTSLVIDIAVQNATCGNQDGTIDITVQGGSGNYAYQWNTGSTDEDLSNLWANVYYVTVTDLNNGCVTTAMATVSNVDGPSISGIVFNATCEAANGSVDVSVQGGQPPYAYTWSNGMLTEDIQNLGAGTYTITVTDDNGCYSVASFTVDIDNTLLLTANVTDAACGMNDGSIDLSVSGGSGNYAYYWSTGETTEDVAGLHAGPYQVQVTDLVSGCVASLTVTISDQSGPVVTGVANDAACPGSNDGSVDITVSGGSGNYTYAWSNGDNTEDLYGQPAGTYVVVVTDVQTGCSTQSVFAIDEVPPFELVADVGCEPDPYISLNVSGANGNYSYYWSNGSTTQNQQGLSTGVYTVTVTDDKGCTASMDVNVAVDCSEEQCDPSTIIIPDVITPNNDNFNDIWVIDNACPGDNEVWIFNRWGDLVYHAAPYLNDWHGKYFDTDKDLPDGTYYYIYRVVSVDAQGNPVDNLDFKGFIVIHR